MWSAASLAGLVVVLCPEGAHLGAGRQQTIELAFGDDATTRQVIARVQADGTCWCGGTVWQGRAAMRISVSSWATTEADVERSLAAILRIADEIR